MKSSIIGAAVLLAGFLVAIPAPTSAHNYSEDHVAGWDCNLCSSSYGRIVEEVVTTYYAETNSMPGHDHKIDGVQTTFYVYPCDTCGLTLSGPTPIGGE